MLKKIVGAAIGAKLAKGSPAVGGATGVALATVVPFIISRASLPTMVMMGAAGYLFKRYRDQQARDENEGS
jgi:hypothetical protein